ncbi:MAG: hypothetical protein KAT28_02560 [Candidatus Aenigmarchaeota archaeon]|nr:hypothetical protein [Candidatus Aenigmarchaeota archaeon]
MSDEIYNPLSAIKDGLILPFVRNARKKGYSEKEITEAAIIGIEKNIKSYEGLIETANQRIKKYSSTRNIDNTLSNMVHEYQGWVEDAEKALGSLNEGYKIVYKSETINPL